MFYKTIVGYVRTEFEQFMWHLNRTALLIVVEAQRMNKTNTSKMKKISESPSLSQLQKNVNKQYSNMQKTLSI